MARIITQKNPWAAQAGNSGGLDPQRSDLWSISLTLVSNGLSRVLGTTVPNIANYYAQSVTLPEPKVRPDVFRRDSRSYNMPSFDEPLDPVKILFILDAPEQGQSSRIYRFLDQWRQVVRAGRGAMSANGNAIPLDADYSIDYAFNVGVFLYRGSTTFFGEDQQNDLEQSGAYTLVNAWLGGFKLGDVSYEGTRVLGIEAQLYVEDIVDQNAGALMQ